MKNRLQPPGSYRRAIVWRDERPIMPRLSTERAVALLGVRGGAFATTHEAAVEIVVHAGFPQYALLGGVFEERAGQHVLELRIDLATDERAAHFPSELAFTCENTYCGIPREFLRGIMEGVEHHVRDAGFPGGLLHVNIGAHDLVGSSINVFRRATRMLMKLIVSGMDDEHLWSD